jgi:ribosomal protein L37E
MKPKKPPIPFKVKPRPTPDLKDGDKDWETECIVCGEKPTVHPTQLCGPCCFGEAETVGRNW